MANPPHQAADQLVGGAGEKADHHVASDGLRAWTDGRLGRVELEQGAARALGEAPASRRQNHAVAFPVEQGDAKFFLQQLELPGDRRLHDMQDVGRPSHAGGLC